MQFPCNSNLKILVFHIICDIDNLLYLYAQLGMIASLLGYLSSNSLNIEAINFVLDVDSPVPMQAKDWQPIREAIFPDSKNARWPHLNSIAVYCCGYSEEYAHEQSRRSQPILEEVFWEFRDRGMLQFKNGEYISPYDCCLT